MIAAAAAIVACISVVLFIPSQSERPIHRSVNPPSRLPDTVGGSGGERPMDGRTDGRNKMCGRRDGPSVRPSSVGRKTSVGGKARGSTRIHKFGYTGGRAIRAHEMISILNRSTVDGLKPLIYKRPHIGYTCVLYALQFYLTKLTM